MPGNSAHRDWMLGPTLLVQHFVFLEKFNLQVLMRCNQALGVGLRFSFVKCTLKEYHVQAC